MPYFFLNIFTKIYIYIRYIHLTASITDTSTAPESVQCVQAEHNNTIVRFPLPTKKRHDLPIVQQEKLTHRVDLCSRPLPLNWNSPGPPVWSGVLFILYYFTNRVRGICINKKIVLKKAIPLESFGNGRATWSLNWHRLVLDATYVRRPVLSRTGNTTILFHHLKKEPPPQKPPIAGVCAIMPLIISRFFSHYPIRKRNRSETKK